MLKPIKNKVILKKCNQEDFESVGGILLHTTSLSSNHVIEKFEVIAVPDNFNNYPEFQSYNLQEGDIVLAINYGMIPITDQNGVGYLSANMDCIQAKIKI